MKLNQYPDLLTFFSTTILNSEVDLDYPSIQTFLSKASEEQASNVKTQLLSLINQGSFSLEEIGMETNRWFSEPDEARAWLQTLLKSFESTPTDERGLVVKDSNGAVLAEGDSVTVIKDLKVKGGSNDLKRGTLIKKIHLTGDPEAVECRVEGSTLVLKTYFLKKV